MLYVKVNASVGNIIHLQLSLSLGLGLVAPPFLILSSPWCSLVVSISFPCLFSFSVLVIIGESKLTLFYSWTYPPFICKNLNPRFWLPPCLVFWNQIGIPEIYQSVPTLVVLHDSWLPLWCLNDHPIYWHINGVADYLFKMLTLHFVDHTQTEMLGWLPSRMLTLQCHYVGTILAILAHGTKLISHR